MDGATPSPEYAVALGNVIHAQCPDREIRLIVRRARNEFRDAVRFRSRSSLTNPAQRDGADFSIITLGACAAGACFLVVGQAGWSTGLRRANTGALAYHMPYIVSLSSLDQTYAQLVCGPAARHAVPSADCER